LYRKIDEETVRFMTRVIMKLEINTTHFTKSITVASISATVGTLEFPLEFVLIYYFE